MKLGWGVVGRLITCFRFVGVKIWERKQRNEDGGMVVNSHVLFVEHVHPHPITSMYDISTPSIYLHLLCFFVMASFHFKVDIPPWPFSHGTHTLSETNSSPPENRPGPKRKNKYSNHPCSGAMPISFREAKPNRDVLQKSHTLLSQTFILGCPRKIGSMVRIQGVYWIHSTC